MLATVADRHVHRSTCKVKSAAATHKSNEVAFFASSGCENPAFLVLQDSFSQHAMHIPCSVLSFGYCFLFRAFSGVGMLSAEEVFACPSRAFLTCPGHVCTTRITCAVPIGCRGQTFVCAIHNVVHYYQLCQRLLSLCGACVVKVRVGVVCSFRLLLHVCTTAQWGYGLQ